MAELRVQTFEVTVYHTSYAKFVFQTHDKLMLQDGYVSWTKLDGSFIAFNWRYISHIEMVELPTNTKEVGK